MLGASGRKTQRETQSKVWCLSLGRTKQFLHSGGSMAPKISAEAVEAVKEFLTRTNEPANLQALIDGTGFVFDHFFSCLLPLPFMYLFSYPPSSKFGKTVYQRAVTYLVETDAVTEQIVGKSRMCPTFSPIFQPLTPRSCIFHPTGHAFGPS
jgi:hypothetical protein